MRVILFIIAILIGGGCSAIRPCQEYDKSVFKDPKLIHGYFLENIRCGELAKAHGVMSKSAKEQIPFEAFFLAIQNREAPELTKRLILGFEQHSVEVSADKKSAVARWCNKEFGISRDYRLLSEFGGRLWTIDFTISELKEFMPAGLEWFKKQREVADGRIQAYPPDWKYTPVMAVCPCGK